MRDRDDGDRDDGDNGDFVKWEESLQKPLFKMGTSDQTIEAFFADDEKVQLICVLSLSLNIRYRLFIRCCLLIFDNSNTDIGYCDNIDTDL